MADEPLGYDDYKQLVEMQMSENPALRQQASDYAKKLTPDEHRAFYDYQKQMNAPPSKTTSAFGVPVTMVGERPRVDTNVIGNREGTGLAPEDFALAGQGIGMARRAVQGAVAAGEGAGGATRAVGGTLAKLGAPAVKFHVAHSMLRAGGLPDPYASWGAAIIAGTGNRGATAGVAQEAEVASAADHPLATGAPMKAADALAELNKLAPAERAAVLRARTQAIAAQRATPPSSPVPPTPMQPPAPVVGPPAPPPEVPTPPPAAAAPPPVPAATPVVVPPEAPVIAKPVEVPPGVKRFTDPDWSRNASRMRAELAIQARRLGFKGETFLTEGEMQSGLRQMKKGLTPDVVARQIAEKRMLSTAEGPAPTSLSSEAQQLFDRLVKSGKSEAEAMRAVQASMALQERFGSGTLGAITEQGTGENLVDMATRLAARAK